MTEPSDRTILHVDMDAYFAAIEQLDRPELRGKPILVGGDPQGRGVVSTASYEARPYGCRSAMPMAQALRLCPAAIVVRPRMERYAEVSKQVFEVLEEFTPLVEPVSIDEAFLDVTGSIPLFGPPEQIARKLKRCIQDKTRLTPSIGVAPNKFLAKLASDLEKPDGLVGVPRDRIQGFLDPIPITRLWGVGKATLPKLQALGVRTFGNLRRFSEKELQDRFGEAGEQFYRLVRGMDDREVVPDREAKSISHEVTFPVDVDDHDRLRVVLLEQLDRVAQRLRRRGRLARTVTLKIRSADFTTITRSKTLETATDVTALLWSSAAELFEAWSGGQGAPVRLIGVGVSQLVDEEGQQLGLFDAEEVDRRRGLDRAIDQIRERYGKDALSRGGPLADHGRFGP